MSQSAAGGCQEWDKQPLIKPLWMGSEEEATARGFGVCHLPRLSQHSEGHGHGRMMLQGTGAKTPSGAAPPGAQIPLLGSGG